MAFLVPAATPHHDAHLAPAAVAGAVALVAPWARSVPEGHAHLHVPDGRCAAAVVVEPTPASRTPVVVDGRPIPTLRLLCAGLACEHRQQPTTKQG